MERDREKERNRCSDMSGEKRDLDIDSTHSNLKFESDLKALEKGVLSRYGDKRVRLVNRTM
eukprot:1356950-Amorphochlora_amoeboformis.AAC.1